MQEFLSKGVISCNLMSLTGYRTLVILNELMKSPKSIDELNEILYNNKYINEKFSDDTLRIYISSLREIGCEISRASKKNNNKFCLISHPFELKILPAEIKYIKKILAAKDSFEITTLIKIENFINRLCSQVNNENTINSLKNLLILQKIDINLLNLLINCCNKKSCIDILYNSPHSGQKEMSIICENLTVKNRKLYITGTSLTHNSYTNLLVERIISILDINIKSPENNTDIIEVTCEIYDKNFIPNENEKIIDSKDNSVIVKICDKNEFFLMQKILYMGNRCKIIAPNDFKQKFLEKIISMEKLYEK